ncbi:glutathione S-transferase family protein [Methylibium rhizosphaerae]|uniref:glutathione S-transferase family protein n=1 Tax=Methylibium rhizosphaerae TaxID=2570323 RepID=UPI00112B1B31|nr:glutathione S-transferase family protein [Methylibium rhizosphaerae]
MILHQYASSPFSEKARLLLGYKGLAYRTVSVPVIAPKPDVVALTGGYRKTPFLQIGADVYCDTALIARVLERLQPEPSLFPAAAGPMAHALAAWADSTLFWTVIPYTMQPAGLAHIFGGAPPEAIKAFAADRAAFTAGMRRLLPHDAATQLGTYLGWLDQQLGRGSRFLLADVPCIADFSVFHCLWYVRRAPPLAVILEPHRHLDAWYERMQAIGHGRAEKMTGAEALALAASADGRHAPVEVLPGLGFEAGEAVTVAATDYGTDPVAGTLVGLSADEVAVRRSDERAGTVVVHFPRIGFQIRKAGG